MDRSPTMAFALAFALFTDWTNSVSSNISVCFLLFSSLLLTVLQTILPAGITLDMFVVSLVILGAIVLVVTESLSIDVAAIATIIILLILELWTQIAPSEGSLSSQV